MKHEGSTARAVKRTIGLISAVASAMAAGVSFMAMTNQVDLGKDFWVNLAVFVISAEYLLLYLYENGSLIDEAAREAFYIDLGLEEPGEDEDD